MVGRADVVFALLAATMLTAIAAAQVNQGMLLATGRWLEITDDPGIAVPVFTAECWISLSSGGLIVTRDSPTGTPSDWQLWCEWSRLRLVFITATGTPDAYFYTADHSVQENTWYHLALVVNGTAGTARLYINGALAIAPTFSPRAFNATTGLCWGGYFGNASGAYLNARMDEARYWTLERSQTELQAAMNAPLRADDRAGLAGYWRLCGNFADSSGNRRDGVPMNALAIVDCPELPAFACSKPAPLAPAITVTGAQVLCVGDSVLLSTDKPYASYRWSTGDTTRSIVVRSNGTYTVTVTDSLGSSGTSAPVTVTVTSPQRIEIGYDGLLLAGDGPCLLPLRVHPAIAPGSACRFAVSVIFDSALLAFDGATPTSGAFWMQPFAVADSGGLVTVSGELQATGTVAELCVLRFNARTRSDAPIPVALRLRDAAVDVACIDTVHLLQPTAFIDGRCRALVRREESASPATLTVYPQPARSAVSVAITVHRAVRARLVLRNSLGACVAVLADGQLAPGSRVVGIDGSRFPRGMYVVAILCDGEVATAPLLLE